MLVTVVPLMMTIRMRRKKLDDKGLDFDGSREAMIALLKAKDKTRRRTRRTKRRVLECS
jgi:hypothetical protein